MSREEWIEVDHGKRLAGGQGSIIKVRRPTDDVLGAMKTLHPHHAASRERRYRMQHEVNALKILSGTGTPRVLDDNARQWEVDDDLFAVFEWIEGPNLADHVGGRPQSMDDSLAIASALADAIEECHGAGIHHRDIKPDNIILRNGSAATPCLVDFGMAWSLAEGHDFETSADQEIGNRFLRLPEFAPTHHRHDPRSDVTLLAGVLFYLITGKAPRVLQDADARPPHEAIAIPEFIQTDHRWPKLSRVFRIAFQSNIKHRYPSAVDFGAALLDLEPSSEDQGEVMVKYGRVQALRESADHKFFELTLSAARVALHAFASTFSEALGKVGFIASGLDPTTNSAKREVTLPFYFFQRGTHDPRIYVNVRISFEDASYEATYSFEKEFTNTVFYTGLVADSESLVEACVRLVPKLLALLLERFGNRLEDQVKFPAVLELGISRESAKVGVYLSEKSETGLDWEPRIQIAALRTTLELTSQQCTSALNELQGRGLIHLSDGTQDYDDVGPTTELFVAFDKYARNWNPLNDARKIVEAVIASDGDHSLTLDELETRLKWPMRRINAAVQYLVHRGFMTASESQPYPRATFWIRENEHTADFLQRSP